MCQFGPRLVAGSDRSHWGDPQPVVGGSGSTLKSEGVARCRHGTARRDITFQYPFVTVAPHR